jgi:hypothetical protein
MPLDPIVSLAVAIAESPGLYAFLLGSGVSRDAGVPTGREVLEIAQADLYRAMTGSAVTPSGEDLATWLEQQGYATLTYSAILELLGPDPETRRAYLAKQFEGREVGESHRLLANLAAEGLVRVFITTNFDRLLETAMGMVGLTPIVVTGASDLMRSSEREHARVYVLKPHGDYLQQTIRNTADELSKLEPELESEVQEVSDRYGLVVVGYSGSDPAIGRLLRQRSSRYGSYWVARSELTAEPKALVEALRARVIVRDTATEFVADLSRRIAAFQVHPSGQTPAAVSAEIIALLREHDEIGIRELLKAEWRTFRARLAAAWEPLADEPTTNRAPEFEREIMPGLERLLAALLPLIEYRSEVFDAQVVEMVRTTDQAMSHSRSLPWPELGQWAMWWLTKACGAAAISFRNFEAVGALLHTHVQQFRQTASLASMLVREVGQMMATVVMEQYGSQKWVASYWEHLRKTLRESPFLQERYPEMVEGDAIDRWLSDFDFLTSFSALRTGQLRVIGFWGMSHSGAVDFARQIATDKSLREAVAQGAFAISGQEFADTVRTVLVDALADGRRLHTPGMLGMVSGAISELPRSSEPSRPA